MSVVYFIIILLVLVVVHEYGHFQTAKWFGMLVDEFAFGFPPRLVSFMHRKTKFSFNLLPLGGYVKIKGEDGDDTGDGSFASKPHYAQIIVLVAGIVMNILIAWVLFFCSLTLGASHTAQTGTNATILITNVSENSAAYKAGFESGDFIKKVNYDGHELIIDEAAQVSSAVADGKPLTVTILRKKEEQILVVVPEKVDGINKIGIEMQPVNIDRLSVGLAFVASAKSTAVYTWATIDAFGGLFKKIFTGHNVGDQLSGPVGIVKQVGEMSEFGLSYLLGFAGILSINLAILNLVPFPGLDGGRIFFVLIETVTRKKVSQKVMGYINGIGIMLLLLLMVVITIKDIVHF